MRGNGERTPDRRATEGRPATHPAANSSAWGGHRKTDHRSRAKQCESTAVRADAAAAPADADLADRHRAANHSFLARIRRLVAVVRPEWTDDRLERATKGLVALVAGLNVLAAADPEACPAPLQREVLAKALAEITRRGRSGGGRRSG